MSSPAEHRRCYKPYGAETTHRSAQLPYHSDEFEWRSARALESKLEEAGVYELGTTGGAKSSHQAVKLPTKSKGQGHQPSFMVSAIAQSKNEARNLKDILAKVTDILVVTRHNHDFRTPAKSLTRPSSQMEKRAVVAEERAAEAVVAERKARADAVAREKQLGSMRLRVSVFPLSSTVLNAVPAGFFVLFRDITNKVHSMREVLPQGLFSLLRVVLG
jgi:hypothetical protein